MRPDVQKLLALCEKGVDNPAFQPEEICRKYNVHADACECVEKSKHETYTRTHCNQFVAMVADGMGFYGFYDHTANAIIEDVEAHPMTFTPCSPAEAAEAAGEGRLVLAGQRGQPHGHVNIVVPGKLEKSGKWKVDVPLVANVGKSVFLGKGANWAFPTPPKYYAWNHLNSTWPI